uniref:Type I restriction enzyme, S subunit n=1 Tax=uncultured prokaryote TaxID=198431 RepID=H5SLU3_9ZZZZ|nr:type I restriction enzyme, S subunit [uncultured prokaryote]
MAGEWREVTIGDFAPFAYGKGLPEHQRDPFGDIPVFGSNGMVGVHSEALTSGPTVIIGRKGTVGAVHYSPKSCWPIDTTFYVTDPDPNVLRFKYYLLKSLGLEHMNADSAVPGLNREAAHARKVRIPPLREQRAIAHILGTLDDKIELNRRMSETLEAMARALFKSWFVDFEPVRAKMEGRWRRGQSLPGLPAHLYDLFPDRLVDSELGEIPEGWRVDRLGDYCFNFDSKRVPLSGRDRANRKGPFPYYGAAGVMDYVDDYLFDGIYLLVGEDGSVMREDGLGVTQYVWGKFWVNNHAHVLQGKPPVSTEQLYLYFAFESVAPYVTGAVQPKLSQGRMNTMPFLFAGEEVCLELHRLVEPWFARIRACAEESRTLAALRDALLPKLISGELRVKDAERFLERVGV